MSHLTVVEASTPEHFHAMSEIHALGWWAAYPDAVPTDWMEIHITPDRWVDTFAAYANTPGHHGFLLYRDDTPVACITCGPARIGNQNHGGGMLVKFDASGYEGWGEIISFYTHPQETGKGYGTILMKRAKAQLKEDGFDRAYVFVLRENEGARRFYARQGFSWDGTQQDIPFPHNVICVDLRYTTTL